MITSTLLVCLVHCRTALSAEPGEAITTVAVCGTMSLMVLQTIRLSGRFEW